MLQTLLVKAKAVNIEMYLGTSVQAGQATWSLVSKNYSKSYLK